MITSNRTTKVFTRQTSYKTQRISYTVKSMMGISFFFAMIVLGSCNQDNDLSDAYGNFEARDVIVSAESTGKIVSMTLEEGALLEKGAQVAWIDTVPIVLKRNQLLAQINAVSTKNPNVQSQVVVLQQQKSVLLVEKKRMENLLKDSAITPQQMDDINGKLSILDKQIEAIQTQNISISGELDVYKEQLAEIEDRLQRCKITNPIQGIVLKKYAEEGEIIAAGRPVYKIADLSMMELKVYVSGNQLANVVLGEKAEILIDRADSTQHLQGTVSWISSEAEFTPKIIQTKEERVNLVYAVKIQVKNEGLLKIGMPGEVNFAPKNNE